MKKVITLLLCIGTLFVSNLLFAQTKTPYQRKVDSIARQFWKDVGIPNSQIDDLIKNGDSSYVRLLPSFRNQLSYFVHYDQNAKVKVAMFEYELKEAEKLKNATDFKRDAAEKKIEENKKLVEEQEKEAEKQKILYNQSDYVALLQSIKEKLGGWLKKGEFEKTEDYNKRIANYKNQFDSICFSEIFNEIVGTDYSISNNIDRKGLRYNKLKIKLGEYNADSEEYKIIVKYGNSEWNNTLKVGIDSAKIFKGNFKDYEAYVFPKDWCFFNYYYTPDKISLINESIDKTITLKIKDVVTNPIVINMKDLKLKDGKDYTFKYDSAFQTLYTNMIDEENRKNEIRQKEHKFKSLVNRANSIYTYGAYRKNPNIDPRMIDDVIKETKEIIGYLEQALQIKSDAKVEAELLEYQNYLKELEKRKKKEGAKRIIKGFLR